MAAAQTALQVIGNVNRVQDDAHEARITQDLQLAERKQAQVAQMLGAASAAQVIGALSQMRGPGGTSKRRRRFADDAMEIV